MEELRGTCWWEESSPERHVGLRKLANALVTSTAYWIAFGPHGPRALPEPGENWKVFGYTMIGLGVSLVLFLALRAGAGPAPQSMTKEWQEATNERLRVWFLFPLHYPVIT
jgi:hypothetical protein